MTLLSQSIKQSSYLSICLSIYLHKNIMQVLVECVCA